MSSLKTQLNRFRTILIVLVIVVVALVLILIRGRAQPATLPSQSIEKVQTRTVEQVVSVDGKVNGTDERFVYLPGQGKITAINVQVGNFVDTTAILGTADVQVGTTTKSVNITAPAPGYIAEINYQVNDIANATTPVFHIINNASYIVTMNVNENDVIDLATNQVASITIPAISLDQQYPGKVSFISPAANSTTGTVTYLTKVTPDSALPASVRPGMSASVDITTARVDDVLAVPANYLIEQDSKEYVNLIVWSDDTHTTYTLAQTEVTTGLKTDEYDEIKTGIKAGDEILDPSFVVVRKSPFGF